MNAIRIAPVFLGFLGVSLLCGVAHATPADDPSARKEAEARYTEGVELHNAGKEDQARLKFEQAYAIVKAPRILFSLARTEELTGRNLEAIRHYRAFVRDPQAPPDFRGKANEAIAELQQKTSRLEVQAPAGTLVSVDGEPLHALSTEAMDVMPGAHHIEGTLGAKRTTTDANAPVGDLLIVTLTFDQTPATPAPTNTAALPPRPSTASEASPTGTRDVVWTTPRILTTAALAVVGGVSTGLALSAAAARSDADTRFNNDRAQAPAGGCAGSTSAACADLVGAFNDRADATNREAAFFIVGGIGLAAAVGTVVAWYLSPVHVDVQPSASPHGAGLWINGSFGGGSR